MTVPDEFEERLEGLENRYGVGPTDLVIASGEQSGEEWPENVDREDIMHEWEAAPDGLDPLTVQEPCVPMHRPPEYSGGIVCMSYQEIAHVYVNMPDEIRDRELEKRLADGRPIPPVLQQ